jgi:hypothetical protein
MQRTPHPKIDKAVHEPDIPLDMLDHIDALIAAAQRDDEERVRVLLSALVPTYVPSTPLTTWGQPSETTGLHVVPDEAEAGEPGEAASSTPPS